MKKAITWIAYIGFYFIGGIMFLYQAWQILIGIISKGKNFNEASESYYGQGVSEEFEPIDLDMMKWWFVIGLLSGIYLYFSGELTWLENWIDKMKKKKN